MQVYYPQHENLHIQLAATVARAPVDFQREWAEYAAFAAFETIALETLAEQPHRTAVMVNGPQVIVLWSDGSRETIYKRNEAEAIARAAQIQEWL